MLGWSREQLTSASKVAAQTIADFERGATSPQQRTLTAIRSALETGGVEFLDGEAPGVRLKRKGG